MPLSLIDYCINMSTPTITCAKCLGAFERIIFRGDDTDLQGHDCSTFSCLTKAGEEKLSGAYGSSHHDGNVYKFVSKPPGWTFAIGSCFCDGCVDKLIQQKIIVFETCY